MTQKFLNILVVGSFNQLENFNKFFYIIFLKWLDLYMYQIVCQKLNIILVTFSFLNRAISVFSKNESMRDYQTIDIYIALIFRTLQLKINYIDLKNYKSQFYSIGIILSLLKLLITKSVRRNLKGAKILLTFFLKKLIKQYRYKSCILNIKGLSKSYLKIFYFLNDLFEYLYVKNFIWIPLKSWNKNNVKIIKSIKRRIRKKLIKLEYKI